MEGPIPVSALIHAATLVGGSRRDKIFENFRENISEKFLNVSDQTKGSWLDFVRKTILEKQIRTFQARTEEIGKKKGRGKNERMKEGEQKEPEGIELKRKRGVG